MTSDDQLCSRLTSLTRDLMLIASTESRPLERKHCFEFIRNHLDGLPHVRIQDHVCNTHESMLALPDTTDVPEILLCGHLDVVDHPQPDCYHSSVREGCIYGPGAGDMKGGDAILIELFRSLQAEYPGLSLGLALTSDEERGGADGVRYLCDEVGLRCGAAIIPDGGSLNDVTVEEKGVLHVRIRRHGREAHGARPWLGENALELLLDRLSALKRHFAQYWPTDDVVEQENHWFATCSITIVGTPNPTPNRIPAAAEAVVDIRFPPPHTVASIQSEVAEILGPDCEMRIIMTSEPTHLAPDPMFCEVTRELTGSPVRQVRASGASDSRFLRQYGALVNLSRPLVGNLHAIDEWIEIESMVTYYRICETYIHRKLLTGRFAPPQNS